MSGFDRQKLSFGSVAEAYDRWRPSYPEQLVDDLTGLLGGQPDQIRALEVGAGTGKATTLFARAGVMVDALEPSAEMAAVARRRLAELPSTSVIEAEFESWTRAGEPYDLLFSATAWHWIDPDRRYGLARSALRAGGVLCPFWNQPIWAECSMRDALAEVHARYAPSLSPRSPMHPATQLLRHGWGGELDDVPMFAPLDSLRYEWNVQYTPEQYTDLVRTHSDYILLDVETRTQLLDAVSQVIEDGGGVLDLPHLTAANVAVAR